MADVIKVTFNPFADVPVRVVVDGAGVADLDEIFVLGVTKDGKAYHASSTGDVGRMLMMLLRARAAIERRDPIAGD